MNRTFLAGIALTATLAAPSNARETDNSAVLDAKTVDSTQPVGALTSYSIRTLPSANPGHVDKIQDPDSPCEPWYKAAIKTTTQYMLTKPEQNNIVAVLKIEPNGDSVLNPDGFDYGPIPALAKMSLPVADQLWATNVQTSKAKERLRKNVARTYYLISADKNEFKDFYLDLLFENNCLQKYQIRSGGTTELNAKWHQVN
jgi:hypothetical protein